MTTRALQKGISAVGYPRPEQLWDRALATLTSDERANIDTSNIHSSRIIDDILVAIEEKKQLCLTRRWKYKTGGRKVIIRDQLEKVIAWIEKFKNVGDILIQYAPSHTALPWAGIRLLLQITIEDGQTFGAMLEGIETVSNTIVRCKIIEDLYLGSNYSEPMRGQLQESLVKLYSSILQYLLRARHYFASNRWKRFLKAAPEPTELSLGVYLNVASQKLSDVDSCVQVINAQGRQSLQTKSLNLEVLLQQLSQPIVRSAEQLSELHDGLHESQRAKILKWLSSVSHRLQHRSVGEDHLAGSGQWLISHHQFLDWRRSSTSSVLWLHGIPGCGKTKLVYAVIEYLLAEKESTVRSAPVAYFYCARSPAEPKRVNVDEIMRNLLKQLSSLDPRHPIREPICRIYQLRSEEAKIDGLEPFPLNAAECVPLILKILRTVPATLVLDAFDECDPDTRHTLLSIFIRLINRSQSLLKIMISTRDDGDMLCRLGAFPYIYINAQDNTSDVNTFIEHSIDCALREKRLLNGQMSQHLKNEVASKLILNANGMFRWVSLQIQNLCNSQRIKIRDDVLQELGLLPKTLNQLYDEIYVQITNLARPSRILAERVLSWLLCGQQLMRKEEIIAASSSDFEFFSLHLSNILDVCANLVVIDKFGYLRFAHVSVREYLECLDIYAIGKRHMVALQRCLDSYRRTSNQRLLNPLTEPDYILRPYAMVYWPVHFWNIDDESIQLAARSDIIAFIFNGNMPSDSFSDWLLDCWNMSQHSSTVDCEDSLRQKLRSLANSKSAPLFLSCCFGWAWLLDALAERHFVDWSMRNKKNQSGLYLAAKWGHESVVEWFFRHGYYRHDDGVEALYVAVDNRDLLLCQKLIQHGVTSHENRDLLLCQKLIQHGVTSNENNATALAVSQNDIDFLSLLYDHEKTVDPEQLITCYDIAHARKHHDIKRFLLLRCQKMNISKYLQIFILSKKLQSPGASKAMQSSLLEFAGNKGAAKLVPICGLFKFGYFNSLRYTEGYVLHHSTIWSSNSCYGDFFITPIYAAVTLDDKVFLNLLIQCGFHPNDTPSNTEENDSDEEELADERSETTGSTSHTCHEKKKGPELPVHRAASDGLVDIMEILIKHGADINRPNPNGLTPLTLAISENCFDTVRRPLGHRVKDGTEYLKFFSIRSIIEAPIRSLAMTRLLLDHGADPNIRDRKGKTTQFHAIKINRLPCLELLIERGADVTMTYPKWINTHLEGYQIHNLPLLAYAIYKHRCNIVQHLLEKNLADVNYCCRDSISPLFAAVQFGCEKCTKLLMQFNVKVDYAVNHPKLNLPIIAVAAVCGGEVSLSIVLVLIDYGANIDFAHPKTGDTALHLLASRFYGIRGVHGIKILLQAGGCLNIANHKGKTPLRIAIEADNNAAINIFQEHEGLLSLSEEISEDQLVAAILDREKLVVQYLLRQGTNVNFIDGHGYTPLLYAMMQSKPSPVIVHLLLAYGASPIYEAYPGFSAVTLAQEKNCVEVLNIPKTCDSTVRAYDIFSKLEGVPDEGLNGEESRCRCNQCRELDRERIRCRCDQCRALERDETKLDRFTDYGCEVWSTVPSGGKKPLRPVDAIYR